MASEGVRAKGLIAGLVLSLSIVVLFAARMDWAQFRGALVDVRWQWVAAGCAGLVLAITIRAVRWAQLAGASAHVGSYWNATVMGYLGNTLYPGRAGELLRIAALRKSLAVPPGELLATAVMDRLTDVVALGIIGAYVSAYTTSVSGGALHKAVIILIGIPLTALAAILVAGARLKPLVARLSSRLPGHWAARLPRWYGQALDAIASLRARGLWVRVAALTVGAFFLDYLVLWMFLKAFAWPLPLGAAVTIGVLLGIGSLLPAAPGYLGIYQVACVLGLAPYGIGESPALAYSVVAQGATISIIGALGAVAGARYGFRLGLTRRD